MDFLEIEADGILHPGLPVSRPRRPAIHILVSAPVDGQVHLSNVLPIAEVDSFCCAGCCEGVLRMSQREFYVVRSSAESDQSNPGAVDHSQAIQVVDSAFISRHIRLSLGRFLTYL